MGRKKILWLCSWYPGRAEPFNGDFVQRHAFAAAHYHDIHVIHVYADPSGKILKREENFYNREGVTEHIIEFPKRNGFISRSLAHFRLLQSYHQAIRRYIKMNGLPDLVHVHVPIWAGKAALWIKKKYGIRFVTTEHWAIYNDQVANNYFSKSKRFKYFTRKIFTGSSMFFPVCDYLAEGVNKLVAPVKYVTIENTVDTHYFKPGDFRGNSFQFIHISNMEERKNVPGIIRAFSRLASGRNDISLVIVGPADEQLKQYARDHHSAIQFTGEISYLKVADNLKMANALVLFSEVENSPCVIGEALCCGVPVISSRVGGIPELVDESNGLLVNAADEEALLNAMATMVDKKRQFGQQDISVRAASRFSYEIVGKKISVQYEALV